MKVNLHKGLWRASISTFSRFAFFVFCIFSLIFLILSVLKYDKSFMIFTGYKHEFLRNFGNIFSECDGHYDGVEYER